MLKLVCEETGNSLRSDSFERLEQFVLDAWSVIDSRLIFIIYENGEKLGVFEENSYEPY